MSFHARSLLGDEDPCACGLLGLLNSSLLSELEHLPTYEITAAAALTLPVEASRSSHHQRSFLEQIQLEGVSDVTEICACESV